MCRTWTVIVFQVHDHLAVTSKNGKLRAVPSYFFNMKQFYLKIIFLVLFVGIVERVGATKNNVLINGVYYSVDSEGTTAVVTSHPNGYTGNVIIEERVNYNGKTYTVKTIGESAFSDDRGLISLAIPPSITYIQRGAFSGCSGLTSIYITDLTAWCNIEYQDYYGYGVYYSNNTPFSYASHLYLNGKEVKDLVIPEGVKSIGGWAFFMCKGITSVSIPNSVTSIGSNSFGGCSNLNTVYISDLKSWCGINFISYATNGTDEERINNNPLLSAHHLILNGIEIKGDLIIPEGVTSLKGAFAGCEALTSITIPQSMSSIDEKSFYGCSNLKTVTINSNYFMGVNRGIDLDFIYNNFCPLSYLFGNQVENYILGESITVIGNYAFYGCTRLVNVTMTNGVTSIGDNSFENCSSLTSLTIPNSVTSIGRCAFRDCTNITTIVFPEGLKEIGESVFDGCSNLINLNISVIDYAAFCKNKVVGLINNHIGKPFHLIDSEGIEIKKYIIPDGVTSIGGEAFCNCTDLTSVTIPLSVTSIGNSAFKGCGSLSSIQLPEGIITIESSAFQGCGFTEIQIPSTVTSIGDNAYKNCTKLTSAIIPKNVTTIGNQIFEGCNQLSILSIDSKTINPWFSGLISIKDLTIGENTISIAESAFANCTGLEIVSIGKNVTSIGYSAFSRCSNLKSVISLVENPYWIDVSVFQYSLTINTTLYVPEGKKELYEKKSCWNQFPNIAELSDEWDTSVKMTFEILSEVDKTVKVGNGKNAAISLETPGNIVIPSVVTRNGKSYKVISIADSAFYACNKMTSIVIPSTIKSFGAYAFMGCSGMQKVIVSDLSAWCAITFANRYSNPIYFAQHLYSDANTEITDLVIPADVNNIGYYAFVKCQLNSVTILGNVSMIGNSSFYKCTLLKSVQMAEGVERIRDNAFNGCTALNSVVFPEGMKRIGGSAFYGCTALETIELPSSLVGTGTYSGIGDNAFKMCSKLKEVKSNIQEPYALGKESFAYIASDAVLYIPVGKMLAYLNAGWTNAVFGGGVVEVGDVQENFCLENEVTKNYILNVDYPDDDYSFTRITDYTTQSTLYRKDLPQPVRIEIPVTKNGKALVLETYSDELLVRSDTFCVGQRALEIWNLVPKTQYTYCLYILDYDGKTRNVVTNGRFTTEGQVRMMRIDDVRNFRDIGGWDLQRGEFVKYDKIFRSAELATTSQIITMAGIHEMLDIQGIGVEIDFGDHNGSPVSEYLEFFRGNDYQISSYVSGVQSKGTQYKNCFEKVVKGLREGKKILFHCTAGADRTGTFAFLLEGLLGVSENDLAKDYELTDFYWEGDTNFKRYRNNKYKDLVDYVKNTYTGSTLNEKIEQMALSFGISQTDITDFRYLMTAKKWTDDIATAIDFNNVSAETTIGVVYNLKGQRVKALTKGIFIQNGRKVVVK